MSTERTKTLLADGKSALEALNGGYHLAYLIGASLTVVAIVAAVTVLREQPMAEMAAAHGAPDEHAPSAEPAYSEY